jgi:hypothetical protein
MHLAGFSSTVLQPLMKVLDGPSDELRFDALDTICALAMALGQDFTIFVPTICKVCPLPPISQWAGFVVSEAPTEQCWASPCHSAS